MSLTRWHELPGDTSVDHLVARLINDSPRVFQFPRRRWRRGHRITAFHPTGDLGWVVGAPKLGHLSDCAFLVQNLGAKDIDDLRLRTDIDRGPERPPALTSAQQKEATRRRAEGATLDELARSYNVSRATILRLAV